MGSEERGQYTPGRIKGPKRRIYTPSLQLWLAAFQLPKQEAEHDDLAIQGDGSGSKMTVHWHLQSIHNKNIPLVRLH